MIGNRLLRECPGARWRNTMQKTQSWVAKASALGAVGVLLAACGGTNTPSTGTQPTSATGSSTGPDVTAAPGAKTGGTLYLLQPSASQEWNQIDPQRAYTGEDLAFFGATIYRSLTAYKYDPDPVKGTSVVADMATDTGTANADASELDASPSRMGSPGRTVPRSRAKTSSTASREPSRTTSSTRVRPTRSRTSTSRRTGHRYERQELRVPVGVLRPRQQAGPGPVRQGRRLQRQDDHLQAERPPR